MKYDVIAEAYINLYESMEHPMIDVDGVSKHRNNSLGQPIHHTDEGIRNFHRWFIGSEAVDDHGRPKVFYHGTTKSFDEFNTNISTGKTEDTGAFFSDNPHVAASYHYGEGKNIIPVYIHMHNHIVVDANGKNWDYIQPKVKGSIPTSSISAKNPTKPITVKTMFKGSWYDPDDAATTDDVARWARNKGYNGAIIKNVKDYGGESSGFYVNQTKRPSTVIVAFHPTQIKSVTGNSGEYSIFSRKITESTYDQIAKAYIQLKEESELPQHLLNSITSSGRYSINNVSPLSYGNGYEIHYSTKKPESAVSYDRYKNPLRNRGPASWYNPKYATLQKANEGESFESQSAVLKPEFSSEIKTNPESKLLYRGISHEEFESIKNTGKIKSKGVYNLEGQEGLTYFSTKPSVAQHYAHSFAPLHFKASHDKPAYVIGIKNPGTGVNVPGTGEHEVGIPHEIDSSEIQEIHRGIPYDSSPGNQSYIKEWGDKEFTSASSSPASSGLVWERIK